MKKLLTIVMLFVCSICKAQEEDLGYSIPDFNMLRTLLYWNDNSVDTFLTIRGWEYMYHWTDSLDKNQRTEYGYEVDTSRSARFILYISADSSGTKYAMNLNYAQDLPYFNYLNKQALDTGFVYVDENKGETTLTKFYEKGTEGFITVSSSSGDGTDIRNGRSVKTHSYWSIVIKRKQYFSYRIKHGMKNSKNKS